MDDIAKVIGVITATVILIFAGPWIMFWLAYFGGWVAKILIGKHLVAGFALLGLNIPIDKLPLIAGCLGWIGGFLNLQTVTTVKKNND